MDLTREAAEGYAFAAAKGVAMDAMTMNDLVKACPHIHTSPAALAWHLGRALYLEGEDAPKDAPLADKTRRAVMSSRGDSMVMRGYKQIELGRFNTTNQIIYRRA